MQIFKFSDVLPQIPALLLRREFGFSFELLPYLATGISRKKACNFFLAALNQYLLPARPLGYPVIGQVEPANYCNLRCPLCLTTCITRSRPPALLSMTTFRRFIDAYGDYLLHLIFWNWGEPFLNPDLPRMIALASAKGIVVHTSTNGNVQLDNAAAEALVDSGLASLVFAVDGATQATYQRYRKGGRLDIVLSNIEKIVRIKKAKGCLTPVINMRFVVMRHNEAEVPMAREFAARLGVDYFTLKTVDMPSDHGDGLDRVYAPQDRSLRRYAYEAGSFKRKTVPFVCMRPWKRVTMDASGEVIPCEYDYQNRHSFGNINSSPTRNPWNSPGAADFRKHFHLGHNNFALCRNCTYKNRVADDCVVKRHDLGLAKNNSH